MYFIYCLLVEEGDEVPEDVAVGRSKQESTLANCELSVINAVYDRM